MSQRKVGNSGDPLTRLASIETPEFLDELVLGKARALLLEQAKRVAAAKGEPLHLPPKHAPAPIATLFARLMPPRLKSS
ncbi:MAG TPA: hypothetical protein VFU02_20275 [Polyangiaceae bacterium]|nr:hypothetical protein [Polyangiaceae bacterium]